MGENEQGGMLRNVVIVGLVALIAAVVIFGITGLKASMNKNTSTAVYNVDKVLKPYQFPNNGDIQFGKYQVRDWNGLYYDIPVTENIQPGYWREIHATFAPETDITVQVDINAFDLDNPNPKPGSDADDVGKREVKMFENGNLVQDMGWGYTKANLQAGHTYQLLVKYHNSSPRTIYDDTSKQRTGSNLTHIYIGTPDGSAGKVKVTDLEAATYNMP